MARQYQNAVPLAILCFLMLVIGALVSLIADQRQTIREPILSRPRVSLRLPASFPKTPVQRPRIRIVEVPQKIVTIKTVKADGKWQLGIDQVPRLIRVDTQLQCLLYYAGGKLVYEFKCSTSVTGRALPDDQHPDTPHDHLGVYNIGAKIARRWSKEYKVWMPWALQYHGGHYIHATTEVGNLGQPASHGCIRLSPANAKTLYQLVEVGDPVEIR